MEAMQKVEAAEKAWEGAPAHVKVMAGAYIRPVLEALRALAGSSCPTAAGEKVMPDGCKGLSCCSGKSSTCMARGCQMEQCGGPCSASAGSSSKTGASSGQPVAAWPFPGA